MRHVATHDRRLRSKHFQHFTKSFVFSIGFEKDCKLGKSLGYSGKSIIHPDQISMVHKLFHPNKSEILWAEKVCKVYLESTKKGKGATTVDGKMIDEVHFKQAKSLLELVK